MFSHKEREFLRLLAEGAPEELPRLLQAKFPNPVYRRRLLWGIRHKALRAASDWELYSMAARKESRVVQPQSPDGSGTVPTFSEPLAALIKRLAALSGGHRNEKGGPKVGGSR
jgi:hypothetical protein